MLRRWPFRIPLLLALVAASAAALAGSALAFLPAPDPGPSSETVVLPRPDAAAGTSSARSRTHSPRRSSTASTGSHTSRVATGGAQAGTTGASTPPAVTVTTPIAPSQPLPIIAATRLAASSKHSGRNDSLLLSAAIALGALTLGSLGLLGLSRRLRQEATIR